MSTAEINEQSTTEDVQKYAEAIANEIAEERKGDAEITSEHADNEKKEPPAASDAGRDDTVTESDEEPTSWIDDDVKAEAAAYGIDEAELAEFANREEMDRALRLFDKSALEAGRKAAKGEVKSEPKPEAKEGGEEKDELDPDIYDEGLVGYLNRMRDRYEARITALEERLIESDVKAKEERFDNLVDAMGRKDLFGKSGSESPAELKRRRDLFEHVDEVLTGREVLGRPAEMDEVLVNRVARMVFAEDFDKQVIKNHTRKLSRQNLSRQGGGATRAQDPREDPRDEFDRLYRELEGR